MGFGPCANGLKFVPGIMLKSLGFPLTVSYV
jgi:hypothetical protein